MLNWKKSLKKFAKAQFTTNYTTFPTGHTFFSFIGLNFYNFKVYSKLYLLKIYVQMKHVAFKILLCLSILFSSSIIYAQNGSKELKDSYDFDFLYKLELSSKKDVIEFDYYLKKDANYFGFDIPKMNQGQESMNMFTIMDTDNAVTAMFMEVMGKKMVKKSKIKLSDFDDEDNSKYNIEKVGSKTILGYNCEGFVMEDSKTKIIFYITSEAPVSFNKIWNTGKTKMPKGFNPAWMEKYAENGLMMEMQYEDKKKGKNNMTMMCVGLEETDFAIEASDYGSMLGMFGG